MVLLLSVMYCQRGIKAITTTMLNSVLGDLAEIANLHPKAVYCHLMCWFDAC